jgi:predicted nucleotide-binding protein
MSIIDPVAKRSADVISKEESVVVAVREGEFSDIANRYPNVWRRLAVVMASRLRERNRFVGNVNDKIRVFIGSSSESVAIANEIQCGLSQTSVLAKVWTNSVFSPSVYFLEALEETSRDVDFAVLIMGPDDKVESRGVEHDAPRDNVIFELGLFIGSLGRKRVFLVAPRGIDIKIPSDLLGITLITYCDLQPADLVASLGPVCTQLRRTMESLGVR